MKVIDLLNKIANGKEVPKYITYVNRLNDEFETMMICKENIIYKLDNDIIELNSVVEVIEEEKKVPEKLECVLNENGEFLINGFTFDYEQKMQIINTVNGIIDYLKSKGDE